MLKVIGAGLPRTGTFTLKTVLEKLTGEPCHHMAEVFQKPDFFIPAFTKASEGIMPHWDEVFEGYGSSCDWPSAAFWPELTAHYPDALVILTKRTEDDEAAGWYTSVSNTILRNFTEEGRKAIPDAFENMIDKLWGYGTGGVDQSDRAAIEAFYDRHMAAVRAAVPAERLLEFTPTEGWEPLCKALGVPVPDEPFPHLNSTKDFNANMDAVEEGKIPTIDQKH